MIEYAVLFIMVALVASVLWLNSKIDKQFDAIWSRFNAVQSKILRLELKSATPGETIELLEGIYFTQSTIEVPDGVVIRGAKGDGISDDTEAIQKILDDCYVAFRCECCGATLKAKSKEDAQSKGWFISDYLLNDHIVKVCGTCMERRSKGLSTGMTANDVKFYAN